MSTPFTYYLRVRYAECDAQKVVFNARYGDYVDAAVTEFFRALGLGPALQDGSVDSQVVKLAIEWRASAKFDDVLALSVHTSKLGTTSYTIATEFRLADRNDVIATAETVYVLVDAATLKKRPLPQSLRDTLSKGAQGIVVDHAGYLSTAR